VSAPVEAPIVAPRTFEECMELARKAQQTEKAMLWATLAQAHATNRIADKLDAFNEFVGVYDEAEEDDNEDAPDTRFADVVAEGVASAYALIKDDILSHPLVQMALAAAQTQAAAAIAQMKNDSTKP
jgi:hypothetical protein